MLRHFERRRQGAKQVLTLVIVLLALAPATLVSSQHTRRDAQRLARLEETLDAKLEQLRRAETDAEADALWAEVHDADAARVAAIRGLSPDARARVLGVGGRGQRELARETTLMELGAPIYLRDLQQRLEHWPAWATALLGRISARSTLFWLFVLGLLTTYILRRRRQLLDALRRRFVDRADTRASAKRRGRAIGWLSALLEPSLLLLAVASGFALLGRLANPIEMVVLRDLLLLWASLNLAVAAFEWMARSLVRRAGSEGATFSTKLARGLRWVSRYLLISLALLRICDELTGRGYLYDWLVTTCWVLTVPLAYALLYRFRCETQQAWLTRHPAGGLARALERHGLGIFGFPFLLVANLRLALGGLWNFGQQIALGFEHTRRGLAFLFRRRLERVAESRGHGAADPAALPAELREAFTAEVLQETEVDGLPELDDVRKAFGEWEAGGPSMDVALVGEQGAGKTAWLAELERRAEPMQVLNVTLDERLLTEAAVCTKVSEILSLEPVEDVDALVELVAQQQRRTIVLLDHAEMLMLRCVGGMQGMEAFSRILRRTSPHLVWVCAFTRSMWDHMRFVMRGTDVFQRSVELNGFSEERIGELVERRLQRCGYEISYEDILPRGVRERDRKAELERVRERYLRLLWDYSDGMPRVALDYWLRSLVIVGDGRARVRLFAAPRAAELERLHEAARFTLHAVMSHATLSVDEATRVLAWPYTECLSILELLRSQQILEVLGKRYRVTARYNRAVVRHLRRQHLLHVGAGRSSR